VLAKEAATLDVLSGGRLELGLGTGYRRADYEQPGIAFDPPAVRVARFEEAVRVVKGFFADAPFTFAGRYYRVQELDGVPKPVQRPHPPILIGGGSKRILSIAAREADIVAVNIRTTPQGEFDFTSITAEATAQKVAWVREAAGARFESLELNILAPLVAVTADRRGAAEQFLRFFGLPTDAQSVAQLLESPVALIGSIDQIVEDLVARRERYGFSYVVVWDNSLDAFAPVVARLAGR
jgi:probable F420-dependent oxidoreductase